jgi:hypothetical protein
VSKTLFVMNASNMQRNFVGARDGKETKRMLTIPFRNRSVELRIFLWKTSKQLEGLGVVVRNEQSNTQAAQMYGTFVSRNKSSRLSSNPRTYKLHSDQSKWRTPIKHRQSTCPFALKKRSKWRASLVQERHGSLEEEEIST